MLLIDNYDSFTFNLVQFFGDLGVVCDVVRNDADTAKAILATKPEAIVLSPGPCTPTQAGVCLDLIRLAPDDLPILGVCLGHQAIVQAFGGTIIQAQDIMHGKISPITHNGSDIFAGLASPLAVTRYHSLIAQPETLPACLQITSQTQDGTIMGVQHKTRPIIGVQFHPESIACENGHSLLQNFLTIAAIEYDVKNGAQNG